MKKEKLTTLIITIVLIALCSYPLFVNLGKLSVRMWDESRNAINAFEMLHDNQFIVTHFEGQPEMWNTKPPLLIWLIALSMKIFGPTMFALRLPSALSALSIALFCLWFSKKQFSSLMPGFFAGAALCCTVGFIDYHTARNGDFDVMLSMWVFFYSLLFFVYLETKERKMLLLFALCICLAILTKGIAACMFLPGLALFVVINKKYWTLFKRSEFYFIPFAGLLLGISYYFIREVYNPGFIKTVIENEITGRYLDSAGGHKGDHWFYLRLMINNHFRFWLWCIPVSIAICFLQKGKIRLLIIFLLIQSLLFFIIISTAQTKLPWYDAPLYPLLALIIGLGAWSICNFLINKFSLKQPYEQLLVFLFLGLILFYYPVKNISASSIKATRETFYPELFYGDFMNSFYKKFPTQAYLKIVSEDYNSHLLFYKKVFYSKGHYIDIVPRSATFHINDTVMICEADKMWPAANLIFFADTIYQEDNNKFVLRINDPKIKRSSIPESEILFYSLMDGIKKNEGWLKKIADKAEKNKVDLEKQIQLDAIWDLETNKRITKNDADKLRVKFKLI